MKSEMSRPLIQIVLAPMVFAIVGMSVCSGQILPVAPEATGKVLHVQGQVQMLKDEVPWALQVGQTVSPRQEILTGPDGYAKIQVPDGSVFEVFPNSRATFRSNQGNLRELLDLWIGRVKIHIEKLNGKPNPNRIQTPTAVISVRGTTYDVTVEDDETTMVLVEEGVVEVQHALLPYSKPKILQGGDYIRVYKNQPLANKSIDKGQILQRMLQVMRDTWLNQPRVGGGPGGSPVPPTTGPTGGVALPGDTQGPSAPPPPPPPPPPGV
jgi:hypothetical protein